MSDRNIFVDPSTSLARKDWFSRKVLQFINPFCFLAILKDDFLLGLCVLFTIYSDHFILS